MSFYSYFESESFINRLDPRGRILFCLLVAATVAFSSSPITFFYAGILSVILLLFANVQFFNLVKRLLVVNLFLVFLWLFLPFSTEGTVIGTYYGLEWTREGVVLCSKMTARANIIVILIISLVSTISLENLGFAFQQLYLPRKLVYIFIFTIRYLQVFDKERERLINAAKVRGFSPGANIHTYKTISYFIGMLLVKSVDRSERVHEAMLCRGFTGDFHAIEHFSFKKKDIVFIALGVILVTVIILSELKFLKLFIPWHDM